MRGCLFYSTVAFICSGISSFASAQFSLSAASPTPAPQLFLAQTEAGPSQPEEPEDTQDEKLASPFEFLEDQSPESTSAGTSDEPAAAQTRQDPAPPSNYATAPAQPVSRYSQTANPADTILTGAYGAHPGYAGPIDFTSHARRTPNPTYQYMMGQWCADGLWDNYEAERAAQCAVAARRIAHVRHNGHCGVSGGCAPQPNCRVCQSGYASTAYRGHLGNFSHNRRAHHPHCSGGSRGQARFAGETACDCDSAPVPAAQLSHSGQIDCNCPACAAQQNLNQTQQSTSQLPNGRPQPTNALVVSAQTNNGRIAQLKVTGQR
jgi:hypothetical protein